MLQTGSDIVGSRRPCGQASLTTDSADAAIDSERHYLVSRAAAELAATARSTSIEAEFVHDALTRAYLEECLGCSAHRTDACAACRFRHVCDQIDGPFADALADQEFSIVSRWVPSAWPAPTAPTSAKRDHAARQPQGLTE